MGVDAVGAKFGGAATILLSFLEIASADPRIEKLSVFTSPRKLRRFDLPFIPKLTEFETPGVDDSRFNRIRWSLYTMGRRCTELGTDVVLCLGNMGIAPIPCVVFIQQSLPFSGEALATLTLRRKAEMTFIREMMRFSCRNAKHIWVQTPIMVRNIQQAFRTPSERISYIMPSVKLTNIPITPDHPLIAQLNAVPPNGRILYVGSDSPYKMLSTLVKGMSLLRQTIPNATAFLTLPTDHAYSNVPGVVCCGYLEGGALRYAYQKATLLVMPSLTETVGLPMVEALSTGIPVVAADRPYAHFVCEDAAAYFDPFSAQSFADVTTRILEDCKLHRELSEKASALAAKQAAKHRYQHMIDQLVEITEL
ncbi:MAG: glycosyltransferase [Anaerolineae bacterium]|nr:glycosyltransferase [Anaerolineae bacterium]